MNEKSKSDITNLRRAQLTRAAYKVVGQKGYYDFTVRDIAREAGLSTGLIHYYFKNKEDLLLNLMREINRNMTTILNRAIGKSDDPREKLNIFMTQAFDLLKTEKDYFYIVIDFWTQVNKNERMKRANIKLFQSYRDEIIKILKTNKGDVPPVIKRELAEKAYARTSAYDAAITVYLEKERKKY